MAAEAFGTAPPVDCALNIALHNLFAACVAAVHKP
jgi:hypothetical protein